MCERERESEGEGERHQSTVQLWHMVGSGIEPRTSGPSGMQLWYSAAVLSP